MLVPVTPCELTPAQIIDRDRDRSAVIYLTTASSQTPLLDDRFAMMFIDATTGPSVGVSGAGSLARAHEVVRSLAVIPADETIGRVVDQAIQRRLRGAVVRPLTRRAT